MPGETEDLTPACRSKIKAVSIPLTEKLPILPKILVLMSVLVCADPIASHLSHDDM